HPRRKQGEQRRRLVRLQLLRLQALEVPVSRAFARLSAAALATALLMLVCLNVGLSDAERSGRDGLVVSLEGSVPPNRLPRHRPVPVTLTLSGTIQSVESSPPQLESLELAFGARGGVTTTGLPRCRGAQLRNASQRQALAECGGAVVGHGTI